MSYMRIITAESVNIGHPDKTCDIIADSFLDEALKHDPNSQMAVECAIKDDQLFIYGEATTRAKIDYEKVARDVLREVGYKCNFKITKLISEQSDDINRAIYNKYETESFDDEWSLQGQRVEKTDKKGKQVSEKEPPKELGLGANDQGFVYGYAVNETPELMPLPIMMAHKLMRQYESFRAQNNKFFSDAKSQVCIAYDGKIPVSVDTILVSVSHAADLSHGEIEKIIKEKVIKPVLDSFNKALANPGGQSTVSKGLAVIDYNDLVQKNTSKITTTRLITENARIIVNPSGRFTVWGSFSDSGCVGRKIVVDSYGGAARVGGGCFSSKNATKVDRSAAYYARYVAKNIVARGLAHECEIQVAYAIGLAEPVSLNIETFGTEKVSYEKIVAYVRDNFNFTPANIINELELNYPIYKPTACYGHFGRDEFPWEKIKEN